MHANTHIQTHTCLYNRRSLSSLLHFLPTYENIHVFGLWELFCCVFSWICALAEQTLIIISSLQPASRRSRFKPCRKVLIRIVREEYERGRVTEDMHQCEATHWPKTLLDSGTPYSPVVSIPANTSNHVWGYGLCSAAAGRCEGGIQRAVPGVTVIIPAVLIWTNVLKPQKIHCGSSIRQPCPGSLGCCSSEKRKKSSFKVMPWADSNDESSFPPTYVCKNMQSLSGETYLFDS